MASRRTRPLVSVAAVVVVLALWCVAGELKLVDPLFLPGPVEVLVTTQQLLTEGYRQVPLWQHILVSLARALFAFSATKSLRPRMVRSADSGSASRAAPPSGVGIV